MRLAPFFLAFAFLVALGAWLGTSCPAPAGVWLVNATSAKLTTVSGVDVVLVGHRRSGTLDYHLDVDGDASDAVGQASFNPFRDASSQSACDTANPWGGFYTGLTTAEKAAACDMARGLGTWSTTARIHHGQESVDTTSGSLDEGVHADLEADSATQSAFDARADDTDAWGSWYAARSGGEKAELRQVVIGLRPQ